MLRPRLFLALMLLVLLPLQQSWAALGPYCAGARLDAVLTLSVLCCDHAGTQADNNQAQPGTDASPGASHGSGNAAGDADCGTCHANGTAPLATWANTPPVPHHTTAPDGAVAAPQAVYTARPERPQWRALA